MADLTLSAAFWNYDRTLPLMDGRVDIPGVNLECTILKPEAAFARAFSTADFDVTELSFSNSITRASTDDLPYRLIPAFLSRAFRHGSIFVRTDRGIRTPHDLRGKTVGLQEYDMTAAVVVRGLLRDGYGIQSQDLKWKVGDRERLKPLALPVGGVPDGVDIEFLSTDRSLDQRLDDGELDAVISLRPPAAFTCGDPTIARLFPDVAKAEQEYFAATGIFPIMHAVGIRNDILTRQPDLGRRLYDAFSQAKALAITELEIVQAAKVTLPWVNDAVDRARSVLGNDIWPYGIEANRHVLETELRWSREDGLQARPVALAELFDPNCLNT